MNFTKWDNATNIQRFESKFVKSGSCWLWTSGIDRKGYGIFSINNKSERAHRFSYEFYRGPIPKGILVCHNCDEFYPKDSIEYRKCVNPKHLWLGTAKDNTQDMLLKGRDNYNHIRKSDGLHSSQKITNKQFIEIKEKCKSGKYLQREIAKQYKISASHVSYINNYDKPFK